MLTRFFSRYFRSKRPLVTGLWAQAAIVFIVNLALLVAGLVYFGSDGKMASYALLVVGAASCQWVLLRGWKG